MNPKPPFVTYCFNVIQFSNLILLRTTCLFTCLKSGINSSFPLPLIDTLSTSKKSMFVFLHNNYPANSEFTAVVGLFALSGPMSMTSAFVSLVDCLGILSSKELRHIAINCISTVMRNLCK